MKIIKTAILIAELKKMAKARFGNLVKAVIDIEKEIIALDADLHADEEAFLLEKGSNQENLWGINLYPDVSGPDWIEYDSMINMRPSQKNFTRGVDDANIRNKIVSVVTKLVKR